jgi:tetratricopeptide (TPR) repeat protein
MKRSSILLLPILCLFILLALIAASASLSGCRSQPRAGPSPARVETGQPGESASSPETEEQILSRQLVSAERYFQEGRYEISRQILMDATDPADPDVQFLQARIALAQGDSTLALFYLKRVVEDGSRRLEAEQIVEAHSLLAELSYESGDLDRAYRSYLQFVNLSGGNVPAEVWIRLSEIALFSRADAESARFFLLNYRCGDNPGQEQSPEGGLLQRLSKRLSWAELSPEQFGLSDANISTVKVDGDDLWIGTWNGGISRYSIGRRKATVFETGSESLVPKTVRSIEVTPTRVWIGTYQGLYQYTKASSRWQKIGFFDEKIEALCTVRGTLYVGTLGAGLWRSRGEKWEKISRGGLPGDFVNSLAAGDDHLLIGTLNLGLVLMSLKTGRIFSFDSINSNLQARNVINLLPDGEDTLWIGTYGEGLYRWNRRENTIEHFNKASGEIADDWVLCSVRADSGLYFGTFGGGVSRFLPEQGRWERIGLHQGLSALDISSVTYAAPRLYFGTLGSGISILDETLVLDGSGGIK